MRRWMRVVSLCMGAVVWLLASTVRAESIAELKEKLLGDEDFRVRTQAALALGATGKKRAVAPLCKGLDDESDTVRAAVAAGLGKLARGGEKCLKRRLRRESSGNVKKMIKKALRLIEEAKSGPSLGSDTRYYFAIGKLRNGTGRSAAAVSKLVRRTFVRIAREAGGFAFAPPGETEAKAKKRLRKYPHVVGYFAKPLVRSTKAGRQISVTCAMDLFSYPDKQSVGSVSRSAGVSGVDPSDESEEDALIEKTCGRAMEEFAKMASQVD